MLRENKKILADLFGDNPLAIAAYLTEKFKENDFDTIRTAMGFVLQAQNVQFLARDAGVRRETLYRTFGGSVDPQLSRILKMFNSLGIQFRVVPLGASRARPFRSRRKSLLHSLRDDSESIAGYLTQAFAENDLKEALFALKGVLEAHNISALARSAGIPRITMYKSFGGKVDPQLSRILKLFVALKVNFIVEALPFRPRRARPKLGRPRKHPASNPREN